MFPTWIVIASFCAADAPPSGALLGWTSNDPVVVRARELTVSGRLAEAEKLLAAEPASDAGAARARREMAEIIRRVRLEYRLDEAGLLKKLAKAIPDATAADLARWREAGQVRHRVLDGRVVYFNREPGCLLRASPEARRRHEAHAPDQTPAAGDARFKQKLIDHLTEVIAAAGRTGRPEVMPIRHRIRYKLTVSPDRPGAKAGSVVRCWLPFPQEYRQQKDVKLLRTSPAEHVLAPAAVDGSPVRGAAQRSVYLEQKITDPSQPVVFEEEFEYTSFAYYPQLKEAEARPLPADFDRTYLAERPPHIIFTPQIRSVVEQVVGAEKNPLAIVRKLYQHLDARVRWWPEEEYAIIPCFAMHGLNAGFGDCGIQSTLFVTLCRAAGVPARWQSGWETKPWGWNMHDWSEVYIEPWGWLPVDMSYGLQPSDDPRVREFYIGHQDAYRLIVNLDYGTPLVPPKQDLRSEPADFQRGEVELDGRNLYFDEWDYEINFDWQPG